MDFLDILMLVSLFSQGVCQKTCASISSFNEVSTGAYLTDVAFEVQDDVGLLECVKECQRRSRCKSFNYMEASGTCELNYMSRKKGYRSRKKGSVYADITDWSKRLAGVCSNGVCPMNSTCSVVNNQPVCDVTYCYISTAQIDANATFPPNHDNLIKEGEMLQLDCPTGYYSDAPVCGSKGIWNGNGTCKPPPLDCDAVKKCDPSAQSGDYWILPAPAGSRAVMVFCAFSNDSKVTTYITLDETNNYSMFPNQAKCNSSVEYCGKTTYTKYKLLTKETFKLASYVTDYAENDCNGKLPRIGLSGGCTNPTLLTCETIYKYFKINTTGTGFIVDPTINWTTSISRFDHNRVIQGNCTCKDICHPILLQRKYQLPVKVDPNYQPAESEATVLSCDSSVDGGGIDDQ